MESKDIFKKTCSAQQQEEIQAIREKYVPKQVDKMAQLRALDAAVNRKAAVRSLVIGTVGTLILGVGMSLIMSQLGEKMGGAALPVGTAVGMVGIAILALAYPVYHRTLKAERKKIAPEILRLSDELMQ